MIVCDRCRRPILLGHEAKEFEGKDLCETCYNDVVNFSQKPITRSATLETAKVIGKGGLIVGKATGKGIIRIAKHLLKEDQ